MNRRFASALATFIIVILVAGPQAQQQDWPPGLMRRSPESCLWWRSSCKTFPG